MADDLNLYPEDTGKNRRRRKRKARPTHLPPYQPDALRPENEQKAKKQLSAAPAAAAFGAKKGAGNALLFHALKTEPLKKEVARDAAEDGDGDGDGDGDDDDAG